MTKLPLDTFDNLERALLALQVQYEATQDRAARQAIRSIVIRGKSKARLAARSVKSEAKRAQKLEMADWMLTWLENPPVFDVWIALRRKAICGPSR
jgi:hypothetical protein